MAVNSEVATQPQIDQLGPVAREYPASKSYSIGLLITGIVVFILGLGGIGWAVSMFSEVFSNSYYSSDTRTGLIALGSIVAVFSLLMIAAGVVMTRVIFRPAQSVTAYEKGLAI